MEFDFFVINRTLVSLIDFFAIWLGAWVFLNNPKHKLNRIFVGMVFFMLLWVNFAYLARVVGEANPSLVLLFLKIAWFATPLFFILLYILVIHLLDENFRYKLLNKAIIFLGIATAFVVGITEYVVRGVEFRGIFLIRLVYGDWMLPFLAVILIIIIATLQPLLREYRLKAVKEKGKIEYLLLGVLVFYVANMIFNIAFPIVFDITRFYFLGDYSTIILLGFIAYAIVRQQLFGIKIVLTSLLVIFIILLLSLDIFIFTVSPVLQFFKAMALVAFLFLGRDLIKSVVEEDERLGRIKKLNEELKEANDSLQELIEMKTSFLHIVSHQLRTPLTAIRGFISMWQEGDFDSYTPRKMAEIKKRIANNAERLNNLVNDMVVAMESEGGLKLTFSSVDVEDLIKTNIEFMKSNYEKKKLYLRYRKTEKTLPKIEADPKYLGNAFMNLIDNAEKYTLKGGLKITINRKEDKIEIVFADTGVGVRNEEKKLLFKKFSRGSKSSYINPNGSGLGLYIIRQIIKMHHGKVSFASNGEGKGTTFIVTLPIRQPVSASPKASGATSVNPSLGGAVSSNPDGLTPVNSPVLSGQNLLSSPGDAGKDQGHGPNGSTVGSKSEEAVKSPPVQIS